MSHADTAVIIPAAGSGERLGFGIPKALVEVVGLTLIEHAVRNLAPIARLIVIAAPNGFESKFRALFPKDSVSVVTGGEVRSASVANAVKVIPGDIKYVLVHDAARAFAPTSLAESILASLVQGEKAVIPALEVVDTIKVVDGNGYVVENLERSNLRAIQTPQGFTREVLTNAHATGDDATDDAALVSRNGVKVKVVPGSSLAQKITTAYDLAWARELVGQR